MDGPRATGSDRQEAGDDAAAVLDRAGQALFRLGRLFGRQSLQQMLARRTGRAVELSRIFVVQAVEEGSSAPGAAPTVGTVAERLGVDPSTASRLVAEALRDDYLARDPAPADARRAQLALTDAGRALAEDARRYQRAVFERVTEDWTAEERHEFARLFVRFADAVARARDEQG